MDNLVKLIIKLLNNHSNLMHTITGFLIGGTSIPSIIKWNSNKKSKQIKRTKARINELDDIVHDMKHADNQIENPKYIKMMKNRYIFKTNVYSKYHIKYFKDLLNQKSKKILMNSIQVKAYKPVIKELIRWCNQTKVRKINKKYFCIQAGKEYIKLIDNHTNIINKFRRTNDIAICYTIYDEIEKNNKGD